MKKYKKIAYIFLIIIVFLFSIFIISRISKGKETEEDLKEKAISEIEFIENKFIKLFNEMNGITFYNYKISFVNIKDENKEENISGDSENLSDENNSKEVDKNNSSDSNNKSNQSNLNKKYDLEESGILTRKNDEVDWKKIKSEVEFLYPSIYNTTIDLYQVANNQEDIINFNKEYDNLTVAVENENKYETLNVLSRLYDYLPKFIRYCTDDSKKIEILRTKNSIFKAYAILDSGDWKQISDNIDNAIQNFTSIVTDINSDKKENKYNINKAYIVMNELQNAVKLNDRNIFLIKYKNLLEELQNI